MATRKVYDLAVKTGEYQSEGKTKGRYQNVGAVMETDDGGRFIMLAKWFNPAGVPSKDGSESILVSMFEPKDKGQPSHSSQPSGGSTGADDIPF